MLKWTESYQKKPQVELYKYNFTWARQREIVQTAVGLAAQSCAENRGWGRGWSLHWGLCTASCCGNVLPAAAPRSWAACCLQCRIRYVIGRIESAMFVDTAIPGADSLGWKATVTSPFPLANIRASIPFFPSSGLFFSGDTAPTFFSLKQ